MKPFILQAGSLELQAGLFEPASGAQRPVAPSRDCEARHRLPIGSDCSKEL